jgi:hypothetical protein
MPAPTATEQLQQALRVGKYGAGAGAGLGALHSILGGGDFLRETLAGALLGGVGSGAAQQYATMDPFQRGGVGGQALEAGGKALAQSVIGGEPLSGAAADALTAAAASVLSGRGRFTPEQQQALIQQFTGSVFPTAGGWQRRLDLAKRVAQTLQGEQPSLAYQDIQTLQRVMPGAQMRGILSNIVERLRGGRFQTPEQKQEIAALGRSISERLARYRQVTPILGAMRRLKEGYAGGRISPETYSKHLGLISGRFGAKTPEAQRLRSFIQEVIARPAPALPTSVAGEMRMRDPEIGRLVARALQR